MLSPLNLDNKKLLVLMQLELPWQLLMMSLLYDHVTLGKIGQESLFEELTYLRLILQTPFTA